MSGSAGSAYAPRGARFGTGIALLSGAFLMLVSTSCSSDVRADASSGATTAGIESAGAIGELDADADGVWQELVARSARITPTGKWDGSLEGEKTLWYPDGAKQGEGKFVSGRKEEAWTFWYESGQKRWEGTYHRDLVHGLERSWYANGALCYEGTSVKGKRHGTFRAWYDNGRPWWKGEYQLGVRQGTFSYWHRDGSPDLKVSGTYVDGKRVRPTEPEDVAAAAR